MSVTGDRLNGLFALIGVACVAALCCPTPLPRWILLDRRRLDRSAPWSAPPSCRGPAHCSLLGRVCVGWPKRRRAT